MTKPENVSLTVRNGPGGTCEVYWGMTKVTQKDLLDMAGQEARGRRSRRSAASRTSTKTICPRRTSAATSTRSTSASARRSSPCSRLDSSASASFPSRRRCPATRRIGVFRHVNADHQRQCLRRTDDGHEHDAADRRHAGSSDHVHHHHSDPDSRGEAGSAGQSAEPAASDRPGQEHGCGHGPGRDPLERHTGHRGSSCARISM